MSRLTQSIHLCFGLPLFLLPGGTISRVVLPTYSWSRLFTWLNDLSHAFLYLSAMFSTSSLSLMSSFLTWSLLVCGRMPICTIFISVTSSFFTWELVTGTVSVPYSIAGWTNMLCIFPLTCSGTLVSHRTPDIFLQLFHPHCVLMFISVLLSPSLCRVLPRYLNYVTCGSWEDCILTLPNCIPFRHMYSVFALDTFTPLFSKASLHCSSSNSSTYFSLAHSTTSSANIISHGASFLVFSVSESIMIANRKGLKAVLGGGQLPLQVVCMFLQHTALQFRFDGTCPSPV